MSPIEAWIQFDSANDAGSNTPYGEHQSGPSTARLISFPPVKPKDIIVEAENFRWRVVSVGYTQRLRAVVHQELVLKEISRGDVEFKLPVNVGDLTKLNPSAERNFTNPQHVDGDADIQDLLAVYGHQPRGSVR